MQPSCRPRSRHWPPPPQTGETSGEGPLGRSPDGGPRTTARGHLRIVGTRLARGARDARNAFGTGGSRRAAAECPTCLRTPGGSSTAVRLAAAARRGRCVLRPLDTRWHPRDAAVLQVSHSLRFGHKGREFRSKGPRRGVRWCLPPLVKGVGPRDRLARTMLTHWGESAPYRRRRRSKTRHKASGIYSPRPRAFLDAAIVVVAAGRRKNSRERWLEQRPGGAS